MNVSIQPVPGNTFSDAMPPDGWEAKLLADSERAFWTHGNKWLNEARQNAPISPTVSLLRKLGREGGTLTIGASKRRGAVTVKTTDYYKPASILAAITGKSAGAGHTANPGGLMRSIQLETGDDFAEVFVASNAEAGSYAVKIHDEKGQTWQKRGPGTQAKGPQADDKFIQRAYDVWRENLAAKLKELYYTVFPQK